MTEPGGDPDRESDRAHPDDEGAAFKDERVRADIHAVDDVSEVPPRLTWNSVTDTGGTNQFTDAERRQPGFHFDLGGALARLGGDAVEDVPAPEQPESLLPEDDRSIERERSAPAIDPLAPVRGLVADEPVEDELPRRGVGQVAHHDDVVPEIREATSATDPLRPYAASHRSVFEDTEPAAAPTLPSSTPSLPSSEPRLPGAASGVPTLPSATPRPTPTPVHDSGPAVPPGMVPTLPPVVPAAPPPVAAPIDSAPSTPDIHALRSAQLRASRQERQGRLFGRTLLALLLLGGLIAVSLVFGRAYLFPTEWDASLTPIVDAIQEERGAEFDHTVPLVVQPSGEYAATVLALTIGDGWIDRVPEWRAAGLAAGDPTATAVASALVADTPVLYDPGRDTIFQSADADPASVESGLRLALETVFARQTSAAGGDDVVATGAVGFTGVSSPQDIVRRAVDRFLADAQGDRASADSDVTVDPTAVLPLPIAYELAAVDRLGEAILLGAGVDPAGLDLGRYPDAIYGTLNDDPVNTAAGLLLPGDRSLADPVALGTDDWSLVWGARLPSSTVDRLVGAVTADSYRPIDRGGTRCFVSVFQTADETAAAFALTALGQWAAAAPAGSGAAATALSSTRVQLEACDPGPGAAPAPDPTGVDALIARQLDRLTP